MQYQARCNHCGRDFKISAQGGQRVKCSCPYCDRGMTVVLPDTVKVKREATENEPTSGGNGSKIFWTAVLVIIIGAAAGLGVWFLYQQNERQNILSERLERAQRRAHRDSLMQIRKEQDAQRRDAEEREIREKSICNFIKSFYLDAIFGDNDASSYRNSFTENCLDKLRSSFLGECETAECLAWELFAPDGEAEDINSLRRNLVVSHYMDNWYKVRFVQRGHTEYRYIRALITGGNIRIDDVR